EYAEKMVGKKGLKPRLLNASTAISTLLYSCNLPTIRK
ncbi:hypothetical protein Q604_UNBC11080G0001, partial [human gut metagenome]